MCCPIPVPHEECVETLKIPQLHMLAMCTGSSSLCLIPVLIFHSWSRCVGARILERWPHWSPWEASGTRNLMSNCVLGRAVKNMRQMFSSPLYSHYMNHPSGSHILMFLLYISVIWLADVDCVLTQQGTEGSFSWLQFLLTGTRIWYCYKKQ